MEVNDSKKASKEVKYHKSYFDVLGLCCSSEAVLVERILKPLAGIQKVSVIVPSKTVIVVHDNEIISQLDIVKILNRASLEANVRAYGTDSVLKKWPSPYILLCGSLLIISLFKSFFHPLRWLAVAAVAVGLPPIILRSIAAIRRYTMDINILMLIAIGGAIALRDYSEAGFIVFLFITAEWLESRASLKATDGMTALMSMVPRKAVLAETGELVDVEDVKVNTNLAVKAGEMIPIDGIVVEGQSEVDERSLTGESFPVVKQPQSLVWAGTLNIDGYITIRTTALAEQSAVTKMAMMVEEAQNSRSKTQRFIDSIEIHAELLPKDKVRLIEELKGRKGFIAMVGDGINDAPALAKADVGFSMGISGTAVASETSHITLMSNDIRKIPKSIRLARKTYRKIIENIIFSVTIKIIILAVAFAGHPILWAAVLADVGTCLLVILNSMMLLRTRATREKHFCGSLHSAPADETKRAGHCVGSKCQSRTSKENKCCSSSKKALMEKFNNAGHHVIGDCKLPSSCRQLKKGIDECSHHDHTLKEEAKAHGNSSNQDYHNESSSHSYCCQESTRLRTCSVKKDSQRESSSHFHHCEGSPEQKTSNRDEHLIIISDGVGRHCHESDEISSCNLDSYKTHDKEDSCSRKNQHGNSDICGNISKQKTDRCCIKNEGYYCDGSQKKLSSNQDNHKSHLESAYSSNIQHETSKICTDISNSGCSNNNHYNCDTSLKMLSCNQDSYKSYAEEDCCSTRVQGGLSKVCGNTPPRI